MKLLRPWLRIIGLVSMALAAVGSAQTTQEQVEKRISQLPVNERAVARFDSWFAALPTADRGSAGNAAQFDAKLLGRYRNYLKEAGFSSAEIDTQLAEIQQRGNGQEVQRWNRYFTAEKPAFNTKPNAFLVEMVKGRTPGRALDVAMGQGRNALWLAQQGWEVTGFDIADKAIAIAQENASKLGVKIHTEIKTVEEFDFGESRWDLVLLSYAGGGQLVQKVERALEPGGLLVVEAFHDDALKVFRIGGSLFRTGELPHLFQGLRSIHYEEPVAQPDFAPKPVRVVRFCAQKPVSQGDVK